MGLNCAGIGVYVPNNFIWGSAVQSFAKWSQGVEGVEFSKSASELHQMNYLFPDKKEILGAGRGSDYSPVIFGI